MFSREELEYIGSVCKKHGVIVLSDEVYERVVFDDNTHVRIGSLPGMTRSNVCLFPIWSDLYFILRNVGQDNNSRKCW